MYCIRFSAICLAGLAAAAPMPGAAQDEPRFDPAPLEACLSGAGDESAAHRCIGTGAEACMGSTPMGQSTVGIRLCFGAEYTYWDDRLNAAYGPLMAREKARDAELSDLGMTTASVADALRAMQRAWIPYRDATCDYEGAQWGNGTGAGAAILACAMDLTGRQALKLEYRLNDGY